MSKPELSDKAKRRMRKRCSNNDMATAIHHKIEFKLARQRDWITVFSIVEFFIIVAMITWWVKYCS